MAAATITVDPELDQSAGWNDDEEGFIHIYDTNEYPWALCGEFVGDVPDAESTDEDEYCKRCLDLYKEKP